MAELNSAPSSPPWRGRFDRPTIPIRPVAAWNPSQRSGCAWGGCDDCIEAGVRQDSREQGGGTSLAGVAYFKIQCTPVTTPNIIIPKHIKTTPPQMPDLGSKNQYPQKDRIPSILYLRVGFISCPPSKRAKPHGKPSNILLVVRRSCYPFFASYPISLKQGTLGKLTEKKQPKYSMRYSQGLIPLGTG